MIEKLLKFVVNQLGSMSAVCGRCGVELNLESTYHSGV